MISFLLPVTWKMKGDKIRLVSPGRDRAAGAGQGEALGGCSPGLRVVCGGPRPSRVGVQRSAGCTLGSTCCQRLSASTRPFASELLSPPRADRVETGGWGRRVAPASVPAAPLGEAGIQGVPLDVPTPRSRRSPGWRFWEEVTLWGWATLSVAHPHDSCLVAGFLRAGCWAERWTRLSSRPWGLSVPERLQDLPCWPWPALLRLPPRPSPSPPPWSPPGAPRLSRLPVPRTWHVTCGGHVLARAKIAASEGAPQAPAAVSREVVARALPAGPVTAGSCVPEPWVGTSRAVARPFSCSWEDPAPRRPRVGQRLTA